MRIIDITMPIREGMPVYKGRPEKQPRILRERQIDRDGINESLIHMNLHTGTHLDTPLHMNKDGWPMEDMPLDRLIVKARLIDLTQVKEGIRKEDLEPHQPKKDEFLLIKTQNSFGLAGKPEFIYLKAGGADYLAQCGIRGLGMDALGVERDQPNHPTHQTLMKHDILILEGLDLKDPVPGEYLLIALPMAIQGTEGAPARAILIQGAQLTALEE